MKVTEAELSGTLLNNFNLRGFFVSYWKDVVLPMEGYQEIAHAFGQYVKKLEDAKKAEFDKLKLNFKGGVTHGNLEDL